jgi:hypothetical protein
MTDTIPDYEFEHTLSNGQTINVNCEHCYSDRSVGIDYAWDNVWATDDEGNAIDLPADLEEEMLTAAANRIDDYQTYRLDDIYGL